MRGSDSRAYRMALEGTVGLIYRRFFFPVGRFLPQAIAVSAFAITSAHALEGNPQKGEILYKACKSCHQVGANARNGVGPHLDGLFGRLAGNLPEFKYSNAMKALGAQGLVWDEAALNEYLKKPRAYVPGTRMSFRGMPEAAKRRDVIAYLKKVSVAAPAGDPQTRTAPGPEMGAAAMALAGDREYGEYLSSECVTCHQLSGHADGIPSIVGWPKSAFIRALFEYKTNVRGHLVMQNVTANLGNEEIAALAAFYSSLNPQ